MRAYERFLNYTKIDTTSDEKNENCPSSENQWILAKKLVDELKEIGIDNAFVDENCYVYAKIPAKGDVNKFNKKIGFISHMDTSPSCSGGPVNAKIIKNYDGKNIFLENNLEIDTVSYPFLNNLINQDIIVTDGTTLLGSDNKAGIAEIMTLCEYLMAENSPNHCEVLIAFTPDEEIGRGADLFDVDGFGANFAFTVDGGELGELEYENFNAANALIKVNGINIHPGSAKNKMKNSQNIAMEFDRLIPAFERPEHTEQYEGFYHLSEINGNEEATTMVYIIRDHDFEKFNNKKEFINTISKFLNEKYGLGTIEAKITDTYYNMRDKVLEHPEIIELAKSAFLKAGIEPIIKPIRGGTDGSRLSYMGLICPNLSTGGFNFHSKKELISIQSMDKMVEVLINICTK